MRVDSARYDGNALVLTTRDRMAMRFLNGFAPGEYEILPMRKRRSRDANNYCWMLCSEIADAIGSTKEDVYRHAIREGNEYTPLPIRADAVEAFRRIWSAKGIGWFAEVVDESKLPGYKLVFAYHGSSTYDTKQMSRLIERLVQDAQALGLDTLSERERTLLLDAWEAM